MSCRMGKCLDVWYANEEANPLTADPDATKLLPCMFCDSGNFQKTPVSVQSPMMAGGLEFRIADANRRWGM